MFGLPDRLRAVNEGRASDGPEVTDPELEERYGVSTKLFVYGTLGPGMPNEHVLQKIGGAWTPATAFGHLREEGWGAQLGAPAIELDPAGTPVEGHVFESSDLPLHWADLDRFEGGEYARLLTCVEYASGESDVANVYGMAP